MPLPTAITDLSQTASSNYPAGSDSPIVLDDTQRAHASFIALLRDGKGNSNPVVLASATTTDIGGQNSHFIDVSGTTTITGFGTTYNGARFLRFTGALILTHNATTLNLPSAANITTVAGDSCIAIPNQALNGWNVVSYQRADGKALAVVATTPSVQIQPISASVAASALTISASALSLDFRSAALTSGTVTTVTGTPANLVISSGSTLGTVSATQSRIAVIAMNNAGTIELVAVNISGGNDLSETGLISTTAEGGAGAADSANVFYSTTARTNVAYRLLGYIESTQATAGTWATAPSTIQGQGGQALTAMSSLGYGQTWQAFTVGTQRVYGTTYYNTTGKPITVIFSSSNQGGCTLTAVVNGVTIFTSVYSAATTGTPLTWIVPAGASYSLSITGSATTPTWVELR